MEVQGAKARVHWQETARGLVVKGQTLEGFTIAGADRKWVKAQAAVDGVDVVHVGCNDLLTNIGKPGAFGDPAIVVAIERVIAAAKANGKYAGLGGERDLARQNAFIKKGVRFVTTQTDLGFLMMAAGQRTMEIRESLAKQA